MNCDDIAEKFMLKVQSLQKARRLNHFNEGMEGEPVVLYYISEKQKTGDVVPGDISNAVGLTTARIAATLSSLEKKGLITREIDINDRRRILIKLTEAGQQHQQVQTQRHMKYLSRMIEELGENDAREYMRIIEKIAEIFNNITCEE